MYLIQERELKSKHHSSFFHRLPALAICDDLSYRASELSGSEVVVDDELVHSRLAKIARDEDYSRYVL